MRLLCNWFTVTSVNVHSNKVGMAQITRFSTEYIPELVTYFQKLPFDRSINLNILQITLQYTFISAWEQIKELPSLVPGSSLSDLVLGPGSVSCLFPDCPLSE